MEMIISSPTFLIEKGKVGALIDLLNVMSRNTVYCKVEPLNNSISKVILTGLSIGYDGLTQIKKEVYDKN